ncbi:MAG: VanZ family protein [Bacteroidales bacterium]|nr:VanZ family protein [Bacteroidales bacterium]
MKKGRLLARIVFLLYLAAVLYLCFGNFSDMSSVAKHFLGIESDKVVHFLMFLPFPILFYMAFGWRTRNPWHSMLMVLAILALGCLIAAGTELVQELIPYRAADIADFMADFLALCIASTVTFFVDQNKTIRHA